MQAKRLEKQQHMSPQRVYLGEPDAINIKPQEFFQPGARN